MQTIEAVMTVGDDGSIIVQKRIGIPPGSYRVVLVIDDQTPPP